MLSVCALLPKIIDIALNEYHTFEPLDCIIYYTQTYIRMRMKMGIRMRWSMRMTTTATTMVKAITTTKSSMRETPNLSTDADRSTD